MKTQKHNFWDSETCMFYFQLCIFQINIIMTETLHWDEIFTSWLLTPATAGRSKSTAWFCLILADSLLHSIAQRIEHVAMCTKSIKLHRLFCWIQDCVCRPAMDALHLPLYQFHQTPPAAFVGFRTVYSQAMVLCICHCTKSIKLHRLFCWIQECVCRPAMDALHLLLYQFHQTPPAAFVGFWTVYSQAMDALHLPLYQIHQTPLAAFVGFRTVYSQAMDALHLLLYQIHQIPPAAFVGFRTVYSQAMVLCICHCTKSIKLHRQLLLDSGLCIAKPWCFAFATVPNPSNSTGTFCWIQDCV